MTVPMAVVLLATEAVGFRSEVHPVVHGGVRKRQRPLSLVDQLPADALRWVHEAAAEVCPELYGAEGAMPRLLQDSTSRLVGLCFVDLREGHHCESPLGDLDVIHKMWTCMEGDPGSRVMARIRAAAVLPEVDAVSSHPQDLAKPFFHVETRQC